MGVARILMALKILKIIKYVNLNFYIHKKVYD